MNDLIEVKVPDIGDFKNVPVIEILVKPGDKVSKESPLITLESDKATIDVPAPQNGTVKDIKVKAGDKISEGDLILTLEAGEASGESAQEDNPSSKKPEASKTSEPQKEAIPTKAESKLIKEVQPEEVKPPSRQETSESYTGDLTEAHASPSVRRFARELGANLNNISGSGPKGRILQEDVVAYIKGALTDKPSGSAMSPAGVNGLNLLPWPQVDFAKYGPIETKPLSRIKKISGANLHRNWVMIPHVTNHDEADITELEAFRLQLNKENEKSGVKITMLAFLIKAACITLKKFPEFNASVDGDNLILKQYYHIGFAADTPNGLVVPVIRDADKKGVIEIAKEMSDLAAKAREGKLLPAEMQGSTFSISSLGGIGGTYFTPIINAPEVAIMGISRSTHKPIWDGKVFIPRLMLPLSLAWDHRVVDGAAAARFNTFYANLLADMRRTLL